MSPYFRTILLILLFAIPALAEDAERVALEIGRDTTYFTEPVNDDGTIDYVAALNAHYGEGVTNENNAFALMVQLFPVPETGSYAEESRYEDRLFDLLNIEKDASIQRYLSWEEYIAGEAIDIVHAQGIYDKARERPWSGEEYPVLKRWLILNQPILERLETALARVEYFSPLVDTEGDLPVFGILLPHLKHHRDLSKLMVIRAFYDLHDGDHTSCVASLMQLHQYGLLVSNETTIIGRLVGISLFNQQEIVIDAIAKAGFLDHQQALRLLDSRSVLGDIEAMSEAITIGQRVEGLDLLVRSYSGEVVQWSALFAGPDEDENVEFNARLDRNLFAITQHPSFDINHVLRSINRLYDELVIIAGILDAERRMRAFNQFDLDLKDAATDEELHVLITSALNPRLPLPEGWNSRRFNNVASAGYAGILLPAIGSAIRTQHRANARRLVESTAIALLGYRDRHGELPDSLDALVPTYFDAVPIDFATGEPLVYRVNDDGSAVVYSIGDNFMDDGGIDDYKAGDIAITIGTGRQ